MKSVDELTLADDFMFGRVMRDRAICRELLERLLKIKIGRLSFPRPQEIITPYYESRGIRLDVYAADDGRAFDIEVQVARKYDLPLRMRYYQSLMDTETLLRGMEYVDLKESYVVFICRFDPFGLGYPSYTFETHCAENISHKIDDRAHKVCYNTTAFEKESDEKVRAFLEYMETGAVTDGWTESLRDRIGRLKETQKFRSNYMTWQMQLKEWKREARAEGMEQGAHNARVETARGMLEYGMPQEKIAEIAGLPLEEVRSLAASHS